MQEQMVNKKTYGFYLPDIVRPKAINICNKKTSLSAWERGNRYHVTRRHFGLLLLFVFFSKLIAYVTKNDHK
ncbi:hypothetical protein HanIR_Chr01g0003031 [Helianthus annuus]|nr:hypothetical protein HanIR_Chr01g0003031 [Helianthus annuus]